MASLNTSSNGPSITKSYQSIVNAPAPTGAAASSPTYGQWAIFSVSAPLANSFQPDGGNKESVLKVQSTGEGELMDLIDEFSDGRVQFAFVKVKDSNSGLPKSALIAWCGEGVPERTKGYFGSHLSTVSKLLHGYHVQITARSDRDLTPDGIIQKVADASGSKYSTSSGPPPVATATKPSVASKPAFTPTQSSGATAPPRMSRPAQNVDEDGWGHDAPPVTRTQLEKVESAYKPTKVNMRELTSSKPAAASANDSPASSDRPDVVRGAYQPIGKVDIAAIRRQAQESGAAKDDRPELVKGAYEPVGKVDIAAIRARAQGREESSDLPSRPKPSTPTASPQEASPSLGARSPSYSYDSGRLTSMPKPQVGNKFAGGGGSFAGTKAPAPGGLDNKPVAPAAAHQGLAGRTYADQGGKTPAQIWAEKKARERGASGSGDALAPSTTGGQSTISTQASGGGGWKSGYTGKSWAPVQTQHTGGHARGDSIGEQRTAEAPVVQEEEEEQPASPAGGISAMRDRFSGAVPMGAPRSTSFNRAPPPAPEPETSTKPNRGIPIPGLPPPPQQRRSPTPPTPEARDASPIRVAVPVSKTQVTDAHDEQEKPPLPIPTGSLNRAVPPPQDDDDDEPDTGADVGRGAALTTATSNVGAPKATGPSSGGERARAEYDYDAAEDNEVSLREGEVVTDIQRVDPDWWMVTNENGQTGLVPSNYLVPLDDDDDDAGAAPAAPGASSPSPAAAAGGGATATALYDYEAGEDNELSFPENAVIKNITFPDEDWWQGEYNGKSGLFPANYTKLDD